MGTVRLRARGSDGKVAIYTGTDDDPFDDPLGNLSRVRFHSDLQYPKVIYEVGSDDEGMGTLDLPSRPANASSNPNTGGAPSISTYNLFEHGIEGTPLVFGYVVVGSYHVPLAGSVPVQWTSRGWCRLLALGADATNVKIAESYFCYISSGFSAVSLDWRVFVTDTVF